MSNEPLSALSVAHHEADDNFCKGYCEADHYALCEHNLSDSNMVQANVCRLFSKGECTTGEKWSCGDCVEEETKRWRKRNEYRFRNV